MVDFKSLYLAAVLKTGNQFGEKKIQPNLNWQIQLKCTSTVSHPNAQLNTVLKFEFTGQQVKWAQKRELTSEDKWKCNTQNLVHHTPESCRAPTCVNLIKTVQEAGVISSMSLEKETITHLRETALDVSNSEGRGVSVWHISNTLGNKISFPLPTDIYCTCLLPSLALE